MPGHTDEIVLLHVRGTVTSGTAFEWRNHTTYIRHRKSELSGNKMLTYMKQISLYFSKKPEVIGWPCLVMHVVDFFFNTN
jgi:hypothetical protein